VARGVQLGDALPARSSDLHRAATDLTAIKRATPPGC
jgi:hypothetical protein